MLNSRLLLCPSPKDLGEPRWAQNPLLGEAWIKRKIKKVLSSLWAPPLSLLSILLCLLSSWRRSHLTITEWSSQASPDSPPRVRQQIKVLLILRSWDAYKAGLLVHNAESSELLLAGLPPVNLNCFMYKILGRLRGGGEAGWGPSRGRLIANSELTEWLCACQTARTTLEKCIRLSQTQS